VLTANVRTTPTQGKLSDRLLVVLVWASLIAILYTGRATPGWSLAIDGHSEESRMKPLYRDCTVTCVEAPLLYGAPRRSDLAEIAVRLHDEHADNNQPTAKFAMPATSFPSSRFPLSARSEGIEEGLPASCVPSKEGEGGRAT
jgi:hypothetical protein